MTETALAQAEATSTAAAADATGELIEWLRRYATRRLDLVRMNGLRRLPPSCVNDLGNRGVLGALAPVADGGLGLQERDVLRLVEQLAAIDIGLAAFVVLHYTSSMPYQDFARPRLRRLLLPDLARGRILASLAITEPAAGSHVRGMATRVQQLGSGQFRIDGEKTFIGHAEWAAVLTCFARHDDGRISAFAVPSDAEGLRVEPEIETLGLRTVVQNPVVFDGVLVDEDHLLGEVGEGMAVAEHALSFGRLASAAIAVGGMRRCAQVMGRFAARRMINTGLLIDNAVSQERMQAVHASVVAVDALAQALMADGDAGRRVPREAYMLLKVAGSELLWRAADDTLQMLGSRGYDEANGIATLFRDARFLRIGEGPTETLLMQVGAAVAHREPQWWDFLRDWAGTGADRLGALAVDVMEAEGQQGSEAAYDRLGRAAMWRLLSIAISRGGVNDPMARSWVDSRSSDTLRAARELGPASFDLDAWSEALAEHDRAVGTLDEAWPVPQSSRDEFLRKEFVAPPEEQSTRRVAASRASPMQRQFAFRVEVPTDRDYRQFGVPAAWTAPAVLYSTTTAAAFDIAQARGCGAEDVLLACFVAFVSRFAGGSELEVLCTRAADGAAPCGALSVDVAGEKTSIDSLIRTVSGALDAPIWQSPAEAIRARPAPSLGSNRLIAGGISVAFAFGEIETVADDAFEGVDLTLLCHRRGDDLHLGWKFDPVAFGAATIARRHANLEEFLLAALENPAADIRRLALLPAGERDLVLHGMNGPSTDSAYHHHTVHGLIEAQVDLTPDAVAVETPRVALTYRELDERANRLAHVLRDRGVDGGEMVAVSTSRSPAMIVGMVGALKAGGQFVIVNPDHPADRRDWIIEETAARVVVVDPATRAGFPDVAANLVVLADDEGAIDGRAVADATRPANTVEPDDVAYVMFTSGSTGRPKGALIPHRAICNQMLARRDELGMRPDDRILQAAAPNFDIAIWELVGPLVFGGRVVMSGDPTFTWDPSNIRRMLRDHAITALQITPSQLTLLLDEMEQGEAAGLRHVICGGESLPKSVQQKFFESGAQSLYNFYGPTEGAIDSSWWRCREDDPSASAPIGRGSTNRLLYVLDELLEPVPIGVPGELFIGGVGLVTGYLNMPELTAERFLDDPFRGSPGGRMYRTGDRVRYRPDGNLEFLGRVDRQIKVRGIRIEPDEIELTLCRHPLVTGCAVTTRPAATGEKRLVAYLSVRPGERPATQDLRGFAQEYLPVEMVPSAFVLLHELPKTSTGKVDFKALPAVDWTSLETESGVGITTETESQVSGIWSELLGIRVEDASADFFELGGHSLLAVQVLSRLRDEYDVEVPISEFFDSSTLGSLAATVDAKVEALGVTPPAADAASLGPPVLRSLGHVVGPETLYLVHPAHGLPTTYDQLAEHLCLPVVVLSAPAGSEVDPSTGALGIEETARLYLDELVRVHRGDDYLLGGWSIGGLLAYEMARQLEARGARVRGLVLFDTPAPARWPRRVAEKEVLLEMMQELVSRAGGSAEDERYDFREGGEQRMRERVSLETQRLGGEGWETSPEWVVRASLFVRRMMLNCAAFSPAGRLDADVALVRAADLSRTPSDGGGQPPDLGWLDHVTSRLCLVETPGDHLTMMFDERAHVLGSRLRDAIATLGRS